MREGGCACGEVRYRLTSEPLFVHCCHCRSCQRQTGSAFVINLLIEADRVELLAGDPVAVDAPRDDGSTQRIFRCPSCSVAVFSNYGLPSLHFVRGGTLDEPAGIEPDVHIYTRSKLPWVELPAGDFQLDPRKPFQMHDLLSGARFLWQGTRNYVELDPKVTPAHIFRLRRHVRTEKDFDYYL